MALKSFLALEGQDSGIWTDPLAREQWYLQNTGQISKTGIAGEVGADIGAATERPEIPHAEGIILAVLDSGLALDHPDLNLQRLARNEGEFGAGADGKDRATNGIDDDGNGFVDDTIGWNFADNSNDLDDTLGHGTHLSGSLIAKSNNALGIAGAWSGFQLLPVKIFSSRRPAPTLETIAAAIRYAVNRGSKVISASFGTPSESPALREALLYAQAHDVLVVSAVGNFRKNLDAEPSYPASYNFSHQISVGATDRRDLPTLFTSFGTHVDIFAPGEEILSTALAGAYKELSGTSQSCPMVAASAAMARVLEPHLSAPEIKMRLLKAADERASLLPFTSHPRRLNLGKLLRNEEGSKIEHHDFSLWREESRVIESEHPYRAQLRHESTVKAPSGTSRFRIYFSRFETQSTDFVEIRSANGRVVTRLSGELPAFWSPVIDGETATLVFSTDAYVSAWGWRIEKIQFTPPFQ